MEGESPTLIFFLQIEHEDLDFSMSLEEII